MYLLFSCSPGIPSGAAAVSLEAGHLRGGRAPGPLVGVRPEAGVEPAEERRLRTAGREHEGADGGDDWARTAQIPRTTGETAKPILFLT